MAIAARIKNLDFRELFTLSWVFISNPLFIIPTYRATRQTLNLCNTNFGKLHRRNNKTNAFRHALWNFLIAQECFNVSGSLERSIHWSGKITDLHETLSPNTDLAKKMDLHNNDIGRDIFRKSYRKQIDIVEILKTRMEEAHKIKDSRDMEIAGSKLVYIED